MENIKQVKILLETTRGLAPFLNKQEISDIGKVLLRATQRMEKEAGEINEYTNRD